VVRRPIHPAGLPMTLGLEEPERAHTVQERVHIGGRLFLGDPEGVDEYRCQLAAAHRAGRRSDVLPQRTAGLIEPEVFRILQFQDEHLARKRVPRHPFTGNPIKTPVGIRTGQLAQIQE
jgi:hypothetical protein